MRRAAATNEYCHINLSIGSCNRLTHLYEIANTAKLAMKNG